MCGRGQTMRKEDGRQLLAFETFSQGGTTDSSNLEAFQVTQKERWATPLESALQRQHQEPFEGLVCMWEPVRVRLFLNFRILANGVKNVDFIAVPLSPKRLIASLVRGIKLWVLGKVHITENVPKPD